MGTVTAVDPHWLAELGGVFYSIRERGGLEPVSRRNRDVAHAKRVEIEKQSEIDRERALAEENTLDIKRRRVLEHGTGAKHRESGGVAVAGMGPPRRGRRVGFR